MLAVRIWITKRRRVSGKTYYTVRWICPETGSMPGRACGSDIRRARTFLERKRRQLEAGVYDDIREAAWDEFTSEHLRSLTGRRNRLGVSKTLRRFGELCRPVGPHVVTYSMVERYVQHRREDGAAPATINRELRELHAAFVVGIKRRRLSKNPLEDFKAEPEHEPVPVVLSDDDKRSLLSACSTSAWRCFLYLLMTTGCRKGEILGLTWDRIEFGDAFLRLTRTKGRRDRLQPLVGDAVAMLRDIREARAHVISDGQAVVKDQSVFARHLKMGVEKGWRRLRVAAGLPKVQMKHLRSSAGTDSASEFSLSDVQDLLGHSSSEVTKRHYVRRTLEQTRRVAESLAKRLKGA